MQCYGNKCDVREGENVIIGNATECMKLKTKLMIVPIDAEEIGHQLAFSKRRFAI